jgi:hypothetical protein
VRCPECNVANRDDAPACEQCGLLLLKVPSLRRRREDLQSERRRSSDLPSVACPFCQGDIPAEAIRCRHCSEYVNAEYRAEATRRRRASINYASWVAYILGLITFVFFRPVGMISIGAGLLLSILYYAIPVEATAPPGATRTHRFGAWLRNTFRLERVAIPIPHLSRRRLVFVGSPLIVALIGFMTNFFLLQHPLNEVLRQNPAYAGMRVSAHYSYWVVPGVVVYDLKGVGVNQTRLDVHTVLVEYARQLRSREFRQVELSYRGQTRFSMSGEAFRKLGEEGERKNLAYVLFEFPRRLGLGGDGDTATDRDALLEFHNRWYANDVLKESLNEPLRVRSDHPPANGASAQPSR